MAQQKREWSRKVRLLVRRYGLTGTKGVVACCVVVVIVLGAVGVARIVGGSELTIDRVDTAQQEGDGDPIGTTTVNAGSSASDGGQKQKGDSSTGSGERQSVEKTVVHVDGAVANPGVYVLHGDSVRVNDAIEQAGGLLPEAETAGLNLAARLEDGQKVHVPVVGEDPGSVVTEAGQNPAMVPSGQSSADSGLININTATEAELQQLRGIGEALAAAIVDDRARNGPFVSTEDLMRVMGIGEKKFAKLRDGICV